MSWVYKVIHYCGSHLLYASSVRLLFFYVEPLAVFRSDIFFFLFYIYLFFPFLYFFLRFLSFYLSLQSRFFYLFSVAPNSLFLPHLFSFFSSSFFFFYCTILYLLLFPASCRWKVGYAWRLHSYLTCYYASFDSLSSCPRIRLAEERPNTAPLLHTVTQHLPNTRNVCHRATSSLLYVNV